MGNELDVRVRLDVNFIEGHVLDGYLVLFICVLLIRDRLFLHRLGLMNTIDVKKKKKFTHPSLPPPFPAVASPVQQ